MKRINQICIAVCCMFIMTVGVLTCCVESSNVLAGGKATMARKSTPTGSLMRIINSHTAKILEALVLGDFEVVVKKSNEIAQAGEVIMKMFFPEGGEPEEWFKETGKDPGDTKAIKAMKAEFEKYTKATIEAARNIASSAGNRNIVETYDTLDVMLKSACFSCHAVSRSSWPNSR